MQVVLLGGALGAAVTVSSGRDRDIAYSRCKYGKNWGKVLHDVCFSANHETVASASGSQLLKFLHYVRVGAIHDTLLVFLQKPANQLPPIRPSPMIPTCIVNLRGGLLKQTRAFYMSRSRDVCFDGRRLGTLGAPPSNLMIVVAWLTVQARKLLIFELLALVAATSEINRLELVKRKCKVEEQVR